MTIIVDTRLDDEAWTTVVAVLPKATSFDDLLVHMTQLALQEIATATDRTLNISVPVEISLSLMSNDQVQELNKQYRQKDKPTNVLSFESGQNVDVLFSERKEGAEMPPLILGDIILAHGVITQEAQEQGKNILDHLTHMTLHSILHLMGYDHQKNTDADVMEALEIKILETHFNIKNPYLSDSCQKGES